MEISLTPDQQAFVRQAIESGRLHDEKEAVQEALALWEERERRRIELIASIEAARGSYAAGKGRPLTEDAMRELAGEVNSGAAPVLPPSSPASSEWRTVLHPKLKRI